ncbi:hypothetical protein [Streptomyces sp. NPDC087298]|uniref:hypothetical protein n=1 Tax=Streptomyces sp. NPDC087298 TaxID=3365779 RepID=UPI0037F874DF
MTGPTTPAVWTFVLDEDEDWVASRKPAGEENLRRAVETLLYGIASAKAAQVYLAAWRADTQRWGTGFSLSTASAVAERVSAGTVRLIDMYGQFTDCEIAAEEFDALLRVYATTTAAFESQDATVGGHPVLDPGESE